MEQDLLLDISRALDKEFYREQDSALLEYLRSQADEDELRARLREISQIEEVPVLDRLIQVGVTAESFTALCLFPLVRVAWADGHISEGERTAVLQAAAEEGIPADSANYQLLLRWLDERPSETLYDAWQEYARALARELDAASLATVRHQTLSRARQIADAAGGLLGLGNRISKSEELTLLDLLHAFDKPADLR